MINPRARQEEDKIVEDWGEFLLNWIANECYSVKIMFKLKPQEWE